MHEQTINNTALVLEGGGFRGIFSAGVLEVFLRQKLYFDYAIGVSAGASYGVSYVSRQAERNLTVNQYIADKRYSSWTNLWKTGSLFAWDFVFKEIPQKHVFFDYEGFRNSSTQFWVGATNCNTGKCEYFKLNQADAESFKIILAASCSLPLIAPLVTIGNQLYIDGGLSDSIPFNKAFAEGNKRAVIILTQPKGYRKTKLKNAWLFKSYYRKFPMIAELLINRAEVYNQTLDELEQLQTEGKVFLIRPEKTIAVGRLENNPEKTKQEFFRGVQLAEKILPQLKEWLQLAVSS